MEQARASWSSLLMLITGVLGYAKILKETEETIGFVMIIFVIAAFQLGWRCLPRLWCSTS